MANAYEELRSSGGIAGETTVALLVQLGGQVTRTSSFPPPEGYDGWSEDAVYDLLASMLSQDGAGSAFVLNCYLRADHQKSLERLFLAAIRNFLIDQAKQTERGKLRRRLDGLLNNDERFTRIPASVGGVPRWALVGGEKTPWQGDVHQLERSAASVRGVEITQWNVSGPTPQKTQEALLTVAYAVLAEAAGSVRDEDLARAIEARFALLTPPRLTALDADETWMEPQAPSEDDPDAQVISAMAAEEIWASLSQIERALVPHLDKPPAELAKITTLGPKKAAAIAAVLKEKIRQATSDDQERDDVVLNLLALCVNRP